MDIIINKIPSMASLKQAIRAIPSSLTEQQLINGYTKIIAALAGYSKGRMPASYYVNATTHASIGIVPKDMWLRQNTQSAKDEYLKEIQKRNLLDRYTFFIYWK